MWRFTRLTNRLNTLRVGLFGGAALAFLYACAEGTAPANLLSTDGITLTEFQYPDSVKYPSDAVRLASASSTRPTGGSGLSASPWGSSSLALSSSASLSSPSLPSYTVAAVTYAPEAAPTLGKGPNCDDCLMSNIPMGFEFTFFGKVYDKINIGSNGIVGFGDYMRDGCCSGSVIPLNDFNNNIIALGQSDWVPNRTTSIRYETRGTAPNRRFLVQFLDVMESSGSGVMTVQLVLYEQSNDIVIHTKALSTSIKSHVLTQGIENLTGGEAAFIPGRVAAKYALSNDAVKFSVTATNKAPVITVPADISVNTGAAVCAANVNVGSATATDDAPGVTISGARSDGLALDAAYPKGVTTIKWTATDVENVSSSASQKVTVSDKENPSITAPGNISVRTDKNVSFAVVDVGSAAAADNCPNVTVTGARSDNAPLAAGYPLGVTTITWTAKDEAGNLASATQTVSVRANQPPVISVPPAISVNTDPGVCAASVNPGTASATDDMPGTVVTSVRNDARPVSSTYPKGLTVITWTATDAEGATSSATQSVTVSDNEKPSIGAPANVSVGNDPGLASASVAVGNAVASDNCLKVSVSSVRSDGLPIDSPYPVGSTTISWKATDASLNYSTATQTVVVRDVTPPTLVLPESFSVNATSSSGAAVSYSVSGSDNVGVTSLSCYAASGSQFPIGVSSVNCAALDAAGNRTSGSFTVTVRGARDQLAILIGYVSGLPLSNGVANPLLGQLDAASRALANNDSHVACVKLDDFLSLVGKKSTNIPASNQVQMIADGVRIETVLGCH
jgi:hypothetical protein